MRTWTMRATTTALAGSAALMLGGGQAVAGEVEQTEPADQPTTSTTANTEPSDADRIGAPTPGGTDWLTPELQPRSIDSPQQVWGAPQEASHAADPLRQHPIYIDD